MGTKLTNRDLLLRMTRGETIDDSIIYDIEFSVDIRGNITIWGGSSHIRDDVRTISKMIGKTKRVNREFVPLYEYERLSPYTARIAQIERDIEISDETLIEEYERFRQEHPSDGFSTLFKLNNIALLESRGGFPKDEEGREISFDRHDKRQLRERLLKQERQDILKLWGVDCPPDTNTIGYGDRLSQGKGQTSEWYRREFEKIGGDYDRLWSR
jgi:hypothetical protein